MEDDSEQAFGDDDAPELTEERFAANLRAVREASGMSQGRLADEMAARGWPWRQQTVTRVENGRRMVRLGEARAVAEILKTSLDDLTQPTGEMRVVELLSEWTHQARAAWLAIKESTVQLLNAKGNLRNHPAVGGGEPPSDRVLEAVREARHIQRLTVEGAVGQGVAETARSAVFLSERAGLQRSVTIEPRSIADAGQIAVALRGGEAVVVDFTGTQDDDIERLQDFINGAVGVRGGSVEHLGDLRYRLVPALLDTHEFGVSARPLKYEPPELPEYKAPGDGA
jgi:FtsZ-interacting cell division protein YlmF/DNA-binding XRE family transcriptional regulator